MLADEEASRHEATDPPNLIRSGVFSLDRLLSHIDPGIEQESEEFVRRIYKQRRMDVASDRNTVAAYWRVSIASGVDAKRLTP